MIQDHVHQFRELQGKRYARLLTLAVACYCSSLGGGAENQLTKILLTVGFNKSNFTSVNQNDAKAAFKVFGESIGRKRGYDVVTQIEVYDTVAEFSKGIIQDGIQLAVIDCWDYLSLDLDEIMDPSFVFAQHGDLLEPYVLLTRRDNGARSLEELREQDILVLENTYTKLARHWLDTILLEQNLGTIVEFFANAKTADKSSAAVLPVFFGQSAACIVDQSAFDLMDELNPQVGLQLRVVATSKPFLDTVLCVKRTGWQSEKERKDLMESLEALHQEPEGKQILTVFKASELEAFQDEYLDDLRELKATHNRLTNATKTSTDASARQSSEGRKLR